MLFWTLLPSEGEIDEAIEFSNLDLVYFHTPHLNIGQREPKLLAFQFLFSPAAKVAQAFLLNARLEAVGATDLGSKGAYEMGGLSRKKYVKFSQKACSQPDSQAKR